MGLQEKQTRIQITKKTASSLKKKAITKSESYNEIINRLITENKALKSEISDLKEKLSNY